MANDDKRREERVVTGRKPYIKPAFQAERTFETMALACGKASGEGQCHIVIKRS